MLSVANLLASNGTVALSLDGLGYTITPTLNFNGSMALTYDVIDGNLGTIAASQSYAVTAVNDVPDMDFDNDGKSDILWRNVVTGADRIWKSGNNTLFGTLKNDVLFGSTGRDTLTGSAGADTFVSEVRHHFSDFLIF